MNRRFDDVIEQALKLMLGLMAAMLIAAVIAQVAYGQAIRVQNLAPQERSSWVTAAVPVEDGQADGEFAVLTDPPMLAILGARSGLRTRLLHLWVAELGAFEARTIPYRLQPLEREADGESASAPGCGPGTADVGFAPPALLAMAAGELVEARLDSVEVVENAGRIVLRSRVRIPSTMLVAEAWWYLYPEARTIPWELFVVCSDPRTKAMRQDIELLELRMPQALVPVVRDRVALGAGQPELDAGAWRVKLLGETWFAEGQGQAWHGVLLRPDGAGPVEALSLAAELHGPVLAAATPEAWERSGAWGPWGVLPEAHPAGRPWLDHIATFERWVAWSGQQRDPWDAGPLQVKRPADTGDQFDFGVTKLSPVLAVPAGGTANLAEAFFRSLKTACRVGYYREANGSPVLEATHPDLVCWGQPIHYHPGVSPDRLGKDPWVQAPDSHGWFGWDREHVSLNELCGVQLMTGSHLLRELVRSNVESWLLGSTIKQGWSTTGRGAPRSVGRTLLAMAWCYQCTGDARIPARMRARLESSYADLIDPGNADELFVLGVHAPDGRKLKGRHRFWMPWQESLGVVGLDAAHRVTGDPRFAELARRVAETVVMFGWWERNPGDWTIGDAIAVLEDGQPLPASAYSDDSLVKDHSGTDFDQWGLPAVKLCLRYAAENMPLQTRCMAILDCLERRRLERGGPTFDRHGEWGAVR